MLRDISWWKKLLLHDHVQKPDENDFRSVQSIDDDHRFKYNFSDYNVNTTGKL